jgi:hypothetical protein
MAAVLDPYEDLDAIRRARYSAHYRSEYREEAKERSPSVGDSRPVLAPPQEREREAQGEIKSWSNGAFQDALALPEDTFASAMQKYSRISQITTDFMTQARLFARMIISEMCVPDSEKTIQQDLHAEGKAGGLKFLHRGILFKLAADTQLDANYFLYGGTQGRNDELACKSFSSELLGACNYLRVAGGLKNDQNNLHVPLQTIISFLGYRLLAMPFIDGLGDVVYGSCDGGKTVHKSDEDFNESMKRCCGELHLKV